MTARRYPFATLEALLGWPSASELAVMAGTTPRTVARWRTDGLSRMLADAVAVLCGFHPAEVWPEWTDEKETTDA